MRTAVTRPGSGAMLVAATALLLAGCSQTDAGTPSAQQSGIVGTTTSRAASASSSSKSSEAASPLADLDPCEMLTDAELAQLNAVDKKRSNLGGSRGCKYRIDTASMSVALYDTKAAEDLNPGQDQVTPTTLGKHQGRRFESDMDDACTIVLNVGQKSAVSVNTAAGSVQEACDIAERTMRLVEPKLP